MGLLTMALIHIMESSLGTQVPVPWSSGTVEPVTLWVELGTLGDWLEGPQVPGQPG